MAILGGLCAVTLDYGIPTFCFVSLSKKAWTAPPNLLRVLVFGTLNLSGFVGVGVTVYLMISGCGRLPHAGEAIKPDGCPVNDLNDPGFSIVHERVTALVSLVSTGGLQ